MAVAVKVAETEIAMATALKTAKAKAKAGVVAVVAVVDAVAVVLSVQSVVTVQNARKLKVSLACGQMAQTMARASRLKSTAWPVPKLANPLTCKVSHAKASVPTQTVRMVNATPLSAPTQIAEIAVTVVAATVSAVARANAIAIWTARPEVRTRKAPATHRVTMAVHPATCARWNLPRLRMRLTPRRVPTAMLL